jgi:hypothetical protein
MHVHMRVDVGHCRLAVACVRSIDPEYENSDWFSSILSLLYLFASKFHFSTLLANSLGADSCATGARERRYASRLQHRFSMSTPHRLLQAPAASWPCSWQQDNGRTYHGTLFLNEDKTTHDGSVSLAYATKAGARSKSDFAKFTFKDNAKDKPVVTMITGPKSTIAVAGAYMVSSSHLILFFFFSNVSPPPHLASHCFQIPNTSAVFIRPRSHIQECLGL